MKKQLMTIGIIGILIAISISGCLENKEGNGSIITPLSGKVTVNTNKSEYGQNETINITLYNGLNVSIYSYMAGSPHEYFIEQVEKKTSLGWLVYRPVYPESYAAYMGEVKPGQSFSFEWEPLIWVNGTYSNNYVYNSSKLEPGVYRISSTPVTSDYFGVDPVENNTWQTVYSNEFTINYSPNPETEYWAILLTFTGVNDFSGNFNTTQHLKNLLVNHGWREDHIRALVGENATYDNLFEAIGWIKNNADSNDVIFLYLHAHGISGNISLADYMLQYSELAEKLETVQYGGLAIYLGACFGDSAIPYLQKENRVILWSQAGDSILWQALSGFGDLRGNNNDWVSVEEIYEMYRFYCTNHSITAVMQDDFPGELNLVNLKGYWRYLDQFNSNDSLFLGSYGCSVGAIKEKIDTWVAQGFIPNLPILTKVSLNVIKHGNPGPLTLYIMDNLSGSNLTSVTLQESHFLTEIEELTDFDFSDIAVVPGTTYYIVVKAPQAIENNGDFNYYTITASHSTNQSDDHYTHGDLLRMNDPFQTHGFFYTDLEFYTFGKLN